MARETGDTAFHEEKGLEGGSKAYARCHCVQRRAGLLSSFSLIWTGRRKRGVLRCVRAPSRLESREPGAVRGRGRGRASVVSPLSPWLSFPLTTGMGQRRGFCCGGSPTAPSDRASIVGDSDSEGRHGHGNGESGLSSCDSSPLNMMPR
ncbi:unnamed protein product [Urochloa humidicola]